MESLFHAYIIGGSREHARRHIEAMLEPFGFLYSGNPDCVVIEQVSFAIDDARALKSWQELIPQKGGHKIYVVYADFINREAQQALLKTLEEPIEGTHIFFAIPNPHMLLPTIISRVQVVIPSGEDETGAEAKKFLALSRSGRLAHVAKLVEKSEDDDAASEVRKRTLALMSALEAELSRDLHKNAAKIETILRLKKYLYVSGASSRMILETIALVV